MNNVTSLVQQLIRCQSIYPNEGGCYKILDERLQKQGFQNLILHFGRADDPPILLARFGTKEPNFCFASHIDVVTAEKDGWHVPAFSGDIWMG